MKILAINLQNASCDSGYINAAQTVMLSYTLFLFTEVTDQNNSGIILDSEIREH